jgi:hypothetical protein
MDVHSAHSLAHRITLRGRGDGGRNICRAANAIATQMKSHRYAPGMKY